MVVFEGVIVVVDGEMYCEKYFNFEDGCEMDESGQGGWVGIMMCYWIVVVILSLDSNFIVNFCMIECNGVLIFDVIYCECVQIFVLGVSLIFIFYIFVGVKELDVLYYVEDEVGVVGFDWVYNWGWLWFLVCFFVWLLYMFEGVIGYFGLVILVLILLIKLVMFLLVNCVYVFMVKMKFVQLKMQEICECYVVDQQKQQQVLMEFYCKEKINLLVGCLLILLQILIFFVFYQILFNVLEMCYVFFFGWIQDMFVCDLLMIGNLFGFLFYDLLFILIFGFVLGLGVWLIIMGLIMVVQQVLNLLLLDLMQVKIFVFLFIVFIFILVLFVVGLVIYWVWNNFLFVVQQYIIMCCYGNEIQLDKLIVCLMGKVKEEG